MESQGESRSVTKSQTQGVASSDGESSRLK